jgi:hypothetical protein
LNEGLDDILITYQDRLNTQLSSRHYGGLYSHRWAMITTHNLKGNGRCPCITRNTHSIP